MCKLLRCKTLSQKKSNLPVLTRADVLRAGPETGLKLLEAEESAQDKGGDGPKASPSAPTAPGEPVATFSAAINAPPVTPDLLKGAAEEHEEFQKRFSENDEGSPAFLADLYIQLLTYVDMSVILKAAEDSKTLSADDLIHMVEVFCFMITVQYGHRTHSREGHSLSTYKCNEFGVELLNFGMRPREQPKRMRHTQDENFMSDLLAQQAVIMQILEKYDIQKHGPLRYVSNSMRANRANKKGGRLVFIYLGPNDIAIDVYCYSIIAGEVIDFLFDSTCKAMIADDIRQAFYGIRVTDELASWLAIMIGSAIYVPRRACLGFKPWPGVFMQVVASFAALRCGESAAEDFRKEFTPLAQGVSLGSLHVFRDVNLSWKSMQAQQAEQA
ncbi:unnamed protein product [Amoebophrya sp. A25]|nr:unnamed protein product [Amoebophrya sp. A25]|eukprot:GSA25T00013266001.1